MRDELGASTLHPQVLAVFENAGDVSRCNCMGNCPSLLLK
jgi:hypothetical protein